MAFLPPPYSAICEGFFCYNMGDAYDCTVGPGAPASRHYFCPRCAPRQRGSFYSMIPVTSLPSQIAGMLAFSPTPKVTPGTLCSAIGCVQPAVDEVEGLIHVGNRLFLDFKGALCQECLDEDFVPTPKEFRRSLQKVHVR